MELGPHLTQCCPGRCLHLYQLPRGILIHPAVWPQQTWLNCWSIAYFSEHNSRVLHTSKRRTYLLMTTQQRRVQNILPKVTADWKQCIRPVRINHALASVWTMHQPYWPHQLYSTHQLLVVWIIVAHFRLCSLLRPLSHYTAVRRPMRVCCGSRWRWCMLFVNILDSLTALPWCIIRPYSIRPVQPVWPVHGACTGRCGRCLVYTNPIRRRACAVWWLTMHTVHTRLILSLPVSGLTPHTLWLDCFFWASRGFCF